MFLFEWVVALFSNILSLDISARIWDSYLFHGDHYLMRVCLAMCACLERQISEDNFEQLVIIFKTVDKYIGEEGLFKAIEDTKLTEKQYETVRRSVENEPDLERLI